MYCVATDFMFITYLPLTLKEATMKTEIKILHTMNKFTKEGEHYVEYICLVIINGTEFIQSFRDFKKGAQ